MQTEPRMRNSSSKTDVGGDQKGLMKRTSSAYKSTIIAQTFCHLKQIAATAIKLQGENQPSVSSRIKIL